MREYGELAGTGRGLRLLDLLARWGVDETPTGKAVWFELGETRGSRAAIAPDHASAGLDVVPAHDAYVDVTLLDVPLLLHAAWQVHAESFLREYLLVQLDEQPEDAAGGDQAHAAANDALALLAGAHPRSRPRGRPGDADGRCDRVEGVGSPGSTCGCRVAPCPTSSCSTRCSTRGSTLADAGGFLTPTIQPELRAMRRWICASVADRPAARRPDRGR